MRITYLQIKNHYKIVNKNQQEIVGFFIINLHVFLQLIPNTNSSKIFNSSPNSLAEKSK